MPPDTIRPRLYITARTRSRRAVFPGPGPRLWEGPGSRAPAARGGGLREHLGPGPRVEAVRPLPRPFRCPGLAPGSITPRPAGVPEAPGRVAGGVGGRVGAAGSGPRGGSALRRGKFGRGKLPPSPPRREEGARGGQARAPRLPLRREPRPPKPAACLAASAGQGGSLRDGQPLLSGYPAAPPAAPRALTSGSGPRLPPVLPPQGAAWGGSLGAGGRASPEPSSRPEEPEGERAREGKPRRRVRACV